MCALACKPCLRRRILGCALCAVCCAMASAVYQSFGHGVTSRAMTYAFMVPLVPGALHLWIWGLAGGVLPGAAHPWQNLLLAGLAAVTAGLYFQGIVEIAGVDGGWERLFYTAGAALCAAGTLGMWLKRRKGAV